MSVRSALSRIAWRIHAGLRADRFRPAYDVQQLVRTVALSNVSSRYPMLSSMVEHWRAGREAEALRLLVSHFSGRREPRFLFDTAALCRDDSGLGGEARHWIALACAQVREMTANGLAVYGRRAPVLRPGFPWKGDWCSEKNDVLFTARPHRFGFAPRLALGVLGKQYSCEEFAALLDDWMRFSSRKPQLPFISTFVVAQRLLASACAFHLLAGAGAADDLEYQHARLALLRIIAQDIVYLGPRVGKSYPNGHLLTDRFVAWFIAVVFPEFSHGQFDLEATENLWLAELNRQTYEDGGSFEHSAHYHGLATEMAAAYLCLKRNNGSTVLPDHIRRIENMLRLQADLAGPDGNAPNFGDAAEDAMFPLNAGTGTTAAALREIYRRLFAPSIPPLAAGHPANERAFWLVSSDGSQSQKEARARRLSVNPDSGLFVLFDDREATRCIFRTGPAPDALTMAGHMHADLMSVCLVHEGVPMLVDSGTCTYRFGSSGNAAGRPNWRKYFSGPHAHNGVVIDGGDPLGPMTGDFRSGPSPAHVRHTNIIEGSELGLVEARITSPQTYAGFGRGVLHVRGQYFLVYNLLGADTPAERAVYPLQLDHRVRVLREQGNALDLGDGTGLGMRFTYSDELLLGERHKGGNDPVGGWISPLYGELVPASQLVFHSPRNGGISAFAFCLNQAAAVDRIASHRIGAEALAFHISGVDFQDHVVITQTSPDRVLSHSGIEFKGRLLWLRVSPTTRTEVRALDILCCKAPYFGVDLQFDSVQREISGI